jgi:hypothetical protein
MNSTNLFNNIWIWLSTHTHNSAGGRVAMNQLLNGLRASLTWRENR